MSLVDSWVAAGLVLLAIWVLLSGLDDLFLDLACLWGWVRRRVFKVASGVTFPTPAELDNLKEKPIAVFVPLWDEHRVIGSMLEHNIAAIRYQNYHYFVGAYPNDDLTLEAVREAENRYPHVHLALCPHDGPTSKADCLNWIYQQMLLFEEEHQMRFEVMAPHDAEDVIHAESLRWINYFAETHDMIQIPVLPLGSPFWKLTHGLYCDEFAEFQSKDLVVRQALGGFLPSNGVGTGYSRRALEKLAVVASNRIFEPDCLTEDYEIGLRLHRLRCRQVFVPIHFLDGKPVATREFFPENLRDAIKQRGRWVIGIALQTWEKHGWGQGLAQVYWFWRDRKGLAGNLGSFLANLAFLYGLMGWLRSWITSTPWGLAQAVAHPAATWLLCGTLFLLALRIGVRASCTARVYGWRFALGVPVRVIWGNWINFFSTASALKRYFLARLRRNPLVWLKTEHKYPSRAALMVHKRPLGEILVGSGYVDAAEVESALRSRPPELRLGQYLVQAGKLSEEELYEALSLQQNVPFERLDPGQVPRAVTRSLPPALAQKWKVLPFKVEPGKLFVAGPELPSDEMQQELRRFTRLEIRFQLITPSNLEELAQAFYDVG
jgi:adsorption protein B